MPKPNQTWALVQPFVLKEWEREWVKNVGEEERRVKCTKSIGGWKERHQEKEENQLVVRCKNTNRRRNYLENESEENDSQRECWTEKFDKFLFGSLMAKRESEITDSSFHQHSILWNSSRFKGKEKETGSTTSSIQSGREIRHLEYK